MSPLPVSRWGAYVSKRFVEIMFGSYVNRDPDSDLSEGFHVSDMYVFIDLLARPLALYDGIHVALPDINIISTLARKGLARN